MEIYKSVFFLIFFGWLITSCENYELVPLKDEYVYVSREIKGNDSNIFYEAPDSVGNYNSDNITFTSSTSILYDYYFQRNGSKFKYVKKDTIHPDSFGKGWDFVDFDLKNSFDTNLVDKIIFSVLPIENKINSGQTLIQYEYVNSNGKVIGLEKTGVVENSRNIWMHPPRMHLFRSFIPAPWPFVCTPYEIGNQCNYNWKWSDFWSDDRLTNWQGLLSNQYQYTIKNKYLFNINNKNIECFLIEANAISNIGETKAKYLFNPDFGFLSFDITLQSGDKLLLTAIDLL